MAYWSNDIGGWQYLPSTHHPEHPPLLDPSDARDNVGDYDDYPELYTRWFEYATFLPIMRTHGSRKYNEVWSYGKQAEPILGEVSEPALPADALHLFARLSARNQTGAPFMRALFMDFPDDPNVADLRRRIHVRAGISGRAGHRAGRDKPQGVSAGRRRLVQLLDQRTRAGRSDDPALTRRSTSCRSLCAPDRLCRSERRSKAQVRFRAIAKVRVYPGADGDFTLYQDDGKTYAYEKGDSSITASALG